MLATCVGFLRCHTNIRIVDYNEENNRSIIERFFSGEATLAEIDNPDFLNITEEILSKEMNLPTIENLLNLRVSHLHDSPFDRTKNGSLEMIMEDFDIDNHEHLLKTIIEAYDRTLPDGFIQISSFEDNLLNGYGKITRPDQTIEEGFFINNVLDRGKMTHPNGESKIGFFSNGLLHGKGIQRVSENGKTYTGNFENGKLNGIGKLRNMDGTLTKGQFKHNELDGLGVVLYPNGGKFKGTFKEDLPEGMVEITSIEFKNNGIVKTLKEVVFENGSPIENQES